MKEAADAALLEQQYDYYMHNGTLEGFDKMLEMKQLSKYKKQFRNENRQKI